MEDVMQFCHWCSKTIKQGKFCGAECLQAAAEMPDLINHNPIKTPVKVASRRRTVLGVIGLTALVGGLVAGFWPAADEPSAPARPYGCVMQPSPVIVVQTATAPVSAFIFTNTTVAKTSEIDALVQTTLPKLQQIYGDMALDTSNGALPTGVLQLNFLIGFDGEVKWVSRTGIDFVTSLDSAAIKGLQGLNFGELPVLTDTRSNPYASEGLEVKVIYRFGDENTQSPRRSENVLPYFQNVR
jgi:hypothetical protein